MVRKKVHKKAALIAEAEAELVKRIRALDNISRIELAHALTLSPATVGTYVDRLLHEGFLLEGAKTAAATGRPRTGLRLNPAAGQFVGVDFYAEEILAVSVDFAQKTVKQTQVPIRKTDSTNDIIHGIIQAVEHVAPADRTRLLGIGIGAPGPVDLEKGMVREYRYIDGFRNVQLAAPISERFNVPVYIENTANAMALAELWFGQGRNLNSFTSVWIRSGISAGIIVDRKLYGGLADGAGEIGFWKVPESGTHSRDGKQLRELEEIASVRAIRNTLSAGKPDAWSMDHIAQAYDAGDPLTKNVIDTASESLGWAISTLSFCLAPERVIIAGPLTALGNRFADSIQKIVTQSFAETGLQIPPVTLSTLGPFSGALGAAALVVDRWKPTR